MPYTALSLPRYCLLLIGFVLFVWASLATAMAATAPLLQMERLNAINISLGDMDKRLEAGNQQDADLSQMRHSIDELATEIVTIIGELTPRAQALSAQLEQLGAKPEEGAPAESQTITNERAETSATLAELNAGVKLAETLMVHANQLSTRISDLRRTAFTSSLFARSMSIWSPTLWKLAGDALPGDMAAVQRAFGNWAADVKQRFEGGGLTYIFGAFLVGIVLHWVRLRILPRLTWRDPSNTGPTRLQKVVKALGLMLGRTIPVAGANLVFYLALDSENLLGGRIAPVISWFLFSIVFIIFMRALSDALFAPELGAWRLLEVDDETARHLSRVTSVGTLAILGGTLLQSTVAAVGAALSLVVLIDGLWALVVAGILVWALRGMKHSEKPETNDFGPYVPAEGDYRGIAAIVGWLAVLAIVCAVTTGYIAFASFIVSQVIWILTVIGFYFLLRVFTEELVEKLPARESKASLFLQTNIGLRRRSVEQLSVLTAGAINIVLLIIAILLIIAPWGMEKDDLYAPVQAIRTGFTIGEISISPIGIASAILTFAVVSIITHALQRWLENKLLPTTGFDAGIRNSIRTAVGYIGFFIAIALACTQLGVSLSRISLVAGALSVGVGFGLQSIVNNFVSGLILLWERPVRVGDWVVVGSEQGYVRRINVRATEIETFDRSSVIIPNSNLVSGVVKNRLHAGKMGRITISIGVAYNSDENEVRQIMMDCARNHPSVLKQPEPNAYLVEFTDNKIRFDMFCFVGNIQESTSVTSQLNMVILQQLRARGFIPPRPFEAEPWHPTDRGNLLAADGRPFTDDSKT